MLRIYFILVFFFFSLLNAVVYEYRYVLDENVPNLLENDPGWEHVESDDVPKASHGYAFMQKASESGLSEVMPAKYQKAIEELLNQVNRQNAYLSFLGAQLAKAAGQDKATLEKEIKLHQELYQERAKKLEGELARVALEIHGPGKKHSQ